VRPIWDKRLTNSSREYTVEDFIHLLGTTHVDPDDGMQYRVIAIRKSKGLIVVDRTLSNGHGNRIDTIHALDIDSYYRTHQPRADASLSTNKRSACTQDAAAMADRPSGQKRKAPLADPSASRGGLASRTGLESSGDDQNHNNLRRSERIARTLAKSHIYNVYINEELKHLDIANVAIPKSYRQARASAEVNHWIAAESSEIQAIKKAGCIVEERPPPGAKIIDCKWVYAVKTNSLNQIVKFKARLSARGDQISNSEVGDVYSPVASWPAIRYYLALTTRLGLTPLQLDFDAAYLNADLKEEVYMRPPPGYELPDGKLWKIVKSLYGLRQSGKNWNELLNTQLLSLGFKPMEEEPCLYSRVNAKGAITILFVYVDDVFIASNRDNVLVQLPQKLQKLFPLKVLGIPQQLLGVEINWGANYESVHLSIPKLINSLQQENELFNCVPTSTPIQPGLRFMKEDCPSKEQVNEDKKLKSMQKRYRRIVGSIIFICYTCRPDIVYATNVLCRSMANPGWKHFEAALHLLRYLAGTKRAGIAYFRNGNLYIIIFADADNGADETRRTCACHFVMFAGGLLVWFSKFIKEYALSTCESEIRAIAAAFVSVKTALYIHKLLAESVEKGVLDQYVEAESIIKLSSPLTILEDNKAAIQWASKGMNTSRMRHVEKSLYWVRQYTASKLIKLEYIKSEDQLADLGTKPLSVTIFRRLAQQVIQYHM